MQNLKIKMQNDNPKLKNVGKRYWVKGGIIAFIIATIFVFLVPLFFGTCIGLNVDGTSSCPKGFEAYAIGVAQTFKPDVLVFITLYFILPCLIVGSIIGWLYGKIKNRRLNI